MMKVEFKLNGRTIPSNRIAAELSTQLRKSATDLATRKLQAIRCPIHRQAARISPARFGSQLEVKGCCAEFVAEVRRQLH